MKRLTTLLCAGVLAIGGAAVAHADKVDPDVQRLNGMLDQLASDPTLGMYAQAEQARARDAVVQLAQAKSRDRDFDLYIAERRVDLARTTAQLQDARAQVVQLDNEHGKLLLEGAQRDAEAARRELEKQRMQYQMAQEAAAQAQQQGAEATAQAQAEAAQAQKLAAAQAKVAHAARREAAAAAAAARAMREQMQNGSTPAADGSQH